ncbi:MAG: GMC family oxidoreductase [Burkholderiaceae bacterium]|jgi:cholesterol oxidase|nr:GMC family oxidoreductase [Burkholderiaceae bacterium]
MDFDYIVIGSGFGGSVSALRLAEKGYRVAVLEQGRHWTAETLPVSNREYSRWLWVPALRWQGFYSIRFFRHMIALHGNAVGGGSITYANTLLVPPAKVWREGGWAGLADWERIMPAHYETASRMLGVTTNRIMGPADEHLREMSKVIGVENTYYPTRVAVYFGQEGDQPGTPHPDPYFGGEGPQRYSCNGCGGCMVGCRYGAKNTLDMNYLHLAQRHGAQVRAQTKVVDVRPLDGAADGSRGYEVEAVSLARGTRGKRTRLRCTGVVFAASSMGTQELLMRLRDRGSLPALSPMLGKHVRTNAESLISVRFPGSKIDFSKGVAIGSGIYIDQYTHIEAVRYGIDSDSMGGLITGPMVGGKPGVGRILAWAGTMVRMALTQPRQLFSLLRWKNWARECVILLCMQTLEGQLSMRLVRHWYWPFSKKLATYGSKLPAFIPAANDFARKAAKACGGVAMNWLSETVLNIPITAHCMGGAVMGSNPQEGVCDAQHRVFGYRNMYICDGSVVSANLGVNPSLTITALAENCMSHIPPKSA